MVIVRVLAGLVLGLVIFAGLLYLLIVVNFSQRLEDPEVYRVAVNETDAYNRVYDEVLVDDALKDQTENLLGGVEFDVQQEAIEILRDIMPPAYLREQTEDNIDRFTNFLKEDQERLEVFVDLEEPLQRVKPAILDRVYQGIDELKIKRPGSAGCSDANLQQSGSRLRPTVRQVVRRRVARISALPRHSSPRECRSTLNSTPGSNVCVERPVD